MAHASFNGLRVLSLESRRAIEVAKLIRTYDGEPLIVSAMREVPASSHKQVFEFANGLMHSDFDLVVFLTGVGVRTLLNVVETKYDREAFLTALRSVKVACRGPKPSSVLRELNVPIVVSAPEPCTWREMLSCLDTEFGDSLGQFRVAVQEYGASNPELLSALTERSKEVIKVPVYQWALPDDLQPLRECVLGIANGSVDVVLFMTAVQVIHLFQVAEQMNYVNELRQGLEAVAVLSIGPTTTEELRHYGVTPDFEPSRPKMGFLVNEAAQYAGRLLDEKRSKMLNLGPRGGVAAATTARDVEEQPAPVKRVAPSTPAMAGFRDGLAAFDFLHEISSRFASADSFHVVLNRIVDFVSTLIPCDSCFIYVLEQDKLLLRASKNPHADVVDHLGVKIGQGITGWVAQHREPVAIASNAANDPRFQVFRNLPEDHFEAILCVPILCASKIVGVITLQHRKPYDHKQQEVRLLSMIGFLVGAEIERARLEDKNVELSDRLETRIAVDRAKGILQRDLAIDESEAYRMMQRESRQRRKSMREIAEAVLLSDELKTVRGTIEQKQHKG
ncbi:uroporphyrinogen-III synthase [Alloacidobacterium dinghuense]|uniref:Uroporphyrinogen-III synthase n=1 Tax=Alloacidobacterium dinghuense TaxID=2763107 RepID=A0A7G8BHP8_9BACT|nr:uroporphyrinogen-III synthase [Alloacidobacterium dinghuense]QNI32068.1 uroporphyrinogen-III synthase [Alloacidobacterium dinghuense]